MRPLRRRQPQGPKLPGSQILQQGGRRLGIPAHQPDALPQPSGLQILPSGQTQCPFRILRSSQRLAGPDQGDRYPSPIQGKGILYEALGRQPKVRRRHHPAVADEALDGQEIFVGGGMFR